VLEELGAKITDVVPCFVDTVEHIGEDAETTGVKVQHFFVCRLGSMDPALRHGPEIEEPCGEYEIVRIPFTRLGIASVHMVPLSLRHYLDGNIEGVQALLAPDLG
ncbi:NUDIX hydrolase, partial [Streptomyces sp. NRRL F-6602]